LCPNCARCKKLTKNNKKNRIKRTENTTNKGFRNILPKNKNNQKPSYQIDTLEVSGSSPLVPTIEIKGVQM
jgi:hypothetical protein